MPTDKQVSITTIRISFNPPNSHIAPSTSFTLTHKVPSQTCALGHAKIPPAGRRFFAQKMSRCAQLIAVNIDNCQEGPKCALIKKSPLVSPLFTLFRKIAKIVISPYFMLAARTLGANTVRAILISGSKTKVDKSCLVHLFFFGNLDVRSGCS